MRIAKTIKSSDPAEAVQKAVNWFFNEQDEYEECEMAVCIRPREDVEVAFIIDERWQKMNDQELKKRIMEMLDKITDRDLLIKTYTFIKCWTE